MGEAAAPRESLIVRVADERRAIALAHELVGLTGLDLRPYDGGWEVAVDGATTDRLVVRVLDAVRQVLAGEPGVTAFVQLDGREYHMNGE
jgi:hypothetical protein